MIQTLFGSLNEPEKKSIFDRMKQAVSKTRDSLGEKIDSVIALTREVDEASLEELEMVLISSDIGVATASEIIAALRERAKRKQIESGAELKQLLKEHLKAILDEHRKSVPAVAPPLVIMMVGINGTGKTTTTGKLAAYFRRDAKTVLLCAADTFRAAAIEQLEVWGQRSGVEMIKTKQGGDPSAVLYDALQAAKARHTDVLIVDTAGRLHTKNSLMAELDKMRRTASSKPGSSPNPPESPASSSPNSMAPPKEASPSPSPANSGFPSAM
jgi:fused signal recognition particle receptor